MLNSIKRFFSSSMSPAPEADEGSAKKDIRLAACALLLELAHADDEFTDDERQHLESAVRRQFGLDAAESTKLLELAQEAREEAVDLWQFTNLIAENYSTGQKMVLAEIMWGLVYSDGELASKEDYLMRKICNLLRLEPGYLAEARQRVTDAGSADPMPGMG
ncbi:MAG: TerB family tellurite resistance protein [Gemmatimonadetes bacterium]|nr:TerB family tellurite resistance protein [Gemmatimonadota bacterium]